MVLVRNGKRSFQLTFSVFNQDHYLSLKLSDIFKYSLCIRSLTYLVPLSVGTFLLQDLRLLNVRRFLGTEDPRMGKGCHKVLKVRLEA